MRLFQLICFAFLLVGISCRNEKAENSHGSDLEIEEGEQMDDQVESPQTQFLKLVAQYKAAKPDSKERGEVLSEITSNEEFPEYDTLQFIVSQEMHDGFRVGSYVKLMSRIVKSDVIEATRCYELMKNDPNGVSQLHSLGTELGKREPEYGLEWMETLDFNRAVYFGSVNLGNGFGVYAATHSADEFIPVFRKYLTSAVFAGKAYDKYSGEGPRMRERMVDGVLRELGRNNKLTPSLSKKLEPLIPEAFVTKLGSYPVLGWSEKKILAEFDPEKFPEECRKTAISIALNTLSDTLGLEECLDWIGKVTNQRPSNASVKNLYGRIIKRSSDDEIIAILRNVDEHDYYRSALGWAKNKAQADRNEKLQKRIKDYEKERRSSKRK